eukprot:1624346-Prymnesium_polylepis.1
MCNRTPTSGRNHQTPETGAAPFPIAYTWVVKRKAVASSRHPIDPQTVRSISWLGLVASPRLARRGPAHSKALCTLSL